MYGKCFIVLLTYYISTNVCGLQVHVHNSGYTTAQREERRERVSGLRNSREHDGWISPKQYKIYDRLYCQRLYILILLISMSQAEAKPSTKQRLAAIVQGFDDFDTEMKTGTRVDKTKCYFAAVCYILICPLLCSNVGRKMSLKLRS